MEFETVDSRRASGSPESILARIRDAATWSDWHPEILSSSGSSRLSAGDLVEGRASMLGFVVSGRAIVLGAGSDRFEQDVVVGVRMRVSIEARPDGTGSIVTHSLVAEMPRGISGRVISLFLRRRLKKMQREVLKRLSAAE